MSGKLDPVTEAIVAVAIGRANAILVHGSMQQVRDIVANKVRLRNCAVSVENPHDQQRVQAILINEDCLDKEQADALIAEFDRYGLTWQRKPKSSKAN